MDPVAAVLLAAAIGALGGLGGAALASLASVRASQIAARAPLADKLHQLAAAIVNLRNAIDEDSGDAEVARLKDEMEKVWNDFATHQRILCPSRRLEILGDFMKRVMRESEASTEDIMAVAGQVHDLIARILSVYSAHLFRVRARGKESKAVENWLDSPEIKRINPQMRERLNKLLR